MRPLTPFVLLSGLAWPLPLWAEDAPLSAIDWLSRSVATPVAVAPAQPGGGAPKAGLSPRASVAVRPPVAGEAPVSGVTDEPVQMSDIGVPSADGIGLVSAAKSGLPVDLWGDTPEAQLAGLLRKERVDTLPSVQSFLIELMLTELAPPRNPAPDARNTLFLARVDRLLDIGALDQAMALLELAPNEDAEIFRRRFDVALLLGEEDKACAIMAQTPGVAPSFPARVFCLARSGDWQAAALSYDSGMALGAIDAEMGELLARFLEPELADSAEPLPPPTRPSPLVFRMMEAIGEPLPTGPLPLAFAHADLKENAGWKAQIEAAERLTRMGVLDPNQLIGLYTQEKASASGGVWDRVMVIARLDAALGAGKPARVAQLLPAAWDAMQSQELEPALAAMFGARLMAETLPEDAARIRFHLGLLGDDFEAVARAHSPLDPDEEILRGIALGDTSGLEAQDQLGLMLKRVFDAPPAAAPAAFAELLPGREGEALLNALDDITEGARGDYQRVENGLLLLRSLGQETVARRTAIEMLVLERNG